jgi:2,3-bisphosphoglycerate-independent phosphoglycerate mutase
MKPWIAAWPKPRPKLKEGGIVLITADHGNAESMIDENGNWHTAQHPSGAPDLVADRRRHVSLRQGILADIAPTILDLMGIEKISPNDRPIVATGRPLL